MQSNSGHHPTPLFGTLVSMVTSFWILSTCQKIPHTTVNIPTMFHEIWWKKSKIFKNPPFFISMATAAKFVLPIPIFLAYLVPLDVDVTGNITAKLCEVWSEFNIFCTLVTMATVAILNFVQPPKAATGYSYKVSWKESNFFFNPPFFVSMATAAKFVQPIPIFFVYLVPLDVDVVPIEFHQFLFGE